MHVAVTTGLEGGWAFVGIVLSMMPIVGLGLTIAGWIQLRRRKAANYESEEDRRRKLNESRTVLAFGMFLWVPFPVIFAIVQIEKALFP